MNEQKFNVLIVDDDKGYLESLVRTVEAAGHSVMAFTDPIVALNKVKINAPNIALVDCMLPKKNGIDFVSELRSIGFENIPVIMMSGVFKDKSYAQKAKAKTQAIEFLTKPFDLDTLHALINENLPKSRDHSEAPLSSFLIEKLDSARLRLDALNEVNEISGYDLPFVINILLEGENNGCINLYDKENKNFKIHISGGNILSLLSDETSNIVMSQILKSKSIDEEELSSIFSQEGHGDLLHNLVSHSYLSPHMLPIIKTEQILVELKKLVSNKKFKFKFTQSDDVQSNFAIKSNFIIPLLSELIDKQVPVSWLEHFYSSCESLPIQLGPHYRPSHQALSLESVKPVISLIDNADKGETLESLIEGKKYDKDKVYKAIHMLAIHRIIVFETEGSIIKVEGDMMRLQDLFETLSMKNPLEVFKYFGASEMVSSVEVGKLYRELAKTYHPDKLKKGTTAEQKNLVGEIFKLLTGAHNILTNTKKREEFASQLKKKDAEKQMKSEAILEDGIVELKRGKYDSAVILLEIAGDLYKTFYAKIHVCWAKLKQTEGGDEDPTLLAFVKNVLDNASSEDRRSPEYHHVLGLFRKRDGDMISAKSCFERALSYDGGFIESRRELANLPQGPKKESSSIFKKDIGSVLGDIFKKKSS